MCPQARKARVVPHHRIIILFVVFLGLCLSVLLLPKGVFTQATETCVQPPAGIIAWWPLDETSGTTAEDIVGTNPGIHVNGPVPAVGHVAGSLRFDGIDDYVGVGDSDRWAFGSSDFTIELWANFNSPGGGTIGHPSHIFIGNDEGPGTQNKWFFALGGGFLNFHINGPVVGSHFFPLTPFSPSLNQWYHLAVTRNGNVWTIYVNGANMGSEVRTVEVPNANAPLTIGQAEQLGFMNGLLDEVTVYERALTQTELQAIFDARSTGKCKALSISTRALSAIQLGVFSTQKLEARFGSAPFNWSVVNGTLPSGMTLSSDGILTGSPTVAGSFPVTIRVTDSLNAIAERNFSLDILLIAPPGDIRIHKTGTLAVPGRTLDYFILVENVGLVTANNSEVLEVLNPPSFFELTATTPPAAVTGNSLIFWVVPTLGPGQVAILSYSVKLNAAVPLGSTVTGQVWLCEAGGGENCIFHILDQIVKGEPNECFDCVTSILPDNKCLLAYDSCRNAITDPLERDSCLIQYDSCRNRCASKCGGLLPEKCTQSAGAASAVTDIKTVLASTSEPGVCTSSDQHIQAAVGAIDPNEKAVIGKKFIQPDQLLVYPIHFENIGDVEARDVFVTDVLDPNLDTSTLNLLTPTGGAFDVATRTVRWDLLNRNLEPGETGNVLLSIRPRPGLPSGTVIRNSATIQFEVFQPIVTNEVVNIIDSTRPTSVVNPLSAETATLDFPISWSGSDAIGEIDFYSIFVSVDGGAFTPFLERTRETSATFRGEVGKTYAFLAIATDTAGNIEVQSATAEASTRIVSNCATGGDNQPPTITGESASPIALWPPNHTMQDIAVDYNAADNCPFTCTLSVTSNEPVNGTGDGDTEPDWAVVDVHHVQLRAERAGSGSGRFYTITITCTDGAGNSTSKDVAVFVAHNVTSAASVAAFKIGPAVNFTGTFWDLPARRHTAQWIFDDTLSTAVRSPSRAARHPETITGAYAFTTSGVYRVKMKVTNKSGGSVIGLISGGHS